MLIVVNCYFVDFLFLPPSAEIFQILFVLFLFILETDYNPSLQPYSPLFELLTFNSYLLTNHLSQIPLITADFPSTFVLAKASHPADWYRACSRFLSVRFCEICQTALAGISGHLLASDWKSALSALSARDFFLFAMLLRERISRLRSAALEMTDNSKLLTANFKLQTSNSTLNSSFS